MIHLSLSADIDNLLSGRLTGGADLPHILRYPFVARLCSRYNVMLYTEHVVT
jgi:hypothetical protein